MNLPANWRSLTWKEIIDWGREYEIQKWLAPSVGKEGEENGQGKV